MERIEITYRKYPGYGWGASSSDMQARFDHGLAAGDSTYAKTRATVEEVVPWSLERDDIELVHFIEESSIPTYLAEREVAERAVADVSTAAKAEV